MRDKVILLITNSTEEYYFSPFVEKCIARELKVHTFYADKFPTENGISLFLNEDGLVSGYLEVAQWNRNGRLTRRLDLCDIDLAWYLRAGRPEPPNELSEVECRFTIDESNAAINSMMAVLPCKWVNKKDRIDALERNKLYQQLIAAQCGFKVPQTTISNDADEVCSTFPNDNFLLLKTLSNTRLDPKGQFFIYSQKMPKSDIAQASKSIQRCPIFCQTYIEKAWEYRIMAIGKSILACKIDSQASEKTRIDWRHYDFENVRHEHTTLPSLVAQNIKKFMTAVDIRYGAIDLIETPKGEFVFLEVNPSGQWQWIEHYASLPITSTIADMLIES